VRDLLVAAGFSYETDGQLKEQLQYEYDDWGRLSEQLELAGQGTNRKKTTYDYDERGRLATERFTNRLDASLDAISTYI